MLQASLSFIRSIKPALGLIFCLINKIYKVYAGNHFRAGFSLELAQTKEQLHLSVYQCRFCFTFFSFFFLQNWGSPLCCSHGKFELRLHNVNLYYYNVYFVSLDMYSYHMYCSLFHDNTDNSD